MNRKFYIGICTLFAFIACLATTTLAQSALIEDTFNPNPNDGVRVVVVQPDGKILIGGDFNFIGPVNRNGIARLNADGTLDTDFNPNAEGSVYAIAIRPDGKILVGGNFISIGGQNRNNIARLDGVTGDADSFDPNPAGGSGPIESIVLQADGKILVGGYFTDIGGQPRNSLGRLDATTGFADSFDPNLQHSGEANGSIFAIAVQPDGKIVVGGDFTTIGGQPRSNIARLDPATGLADSFSPDANSGLNDDSVLTVAVQPDGKILAGGEFGHIGGQTRINIARLDSVSGLADSFNPNADGLVYSIVVQPFGRVLVGGQFTSIGGQTRNNIARLDPVTGLADQFNPNTQPDGRIVRSITLQPDGKILLCGTFDSINGLNIPGVARYIGDFITPTGSNIGVVFGSVSVTFTTVSVTGTTTGVPVSPPPFPPIYGCPSASPSCQFPNYDITTTAHYAGTITVCLQVAGVTDPTTFAALRILHNENGTLIDRTILPPNTPAPNFVTKTICARVNSLSPFAVAHLQSPTAANASVGGRVLTTYSRGLRNTVVILTDPQGHSRYAITSSFGYYRFDNVPAGGTYIVSVGSKRFHFLTQIVNVSDNLAGVDFVADP